MRGLLALLLLRGGDEKFHQPLGRIVVRVHQEGQRRPLDVVESMRAAPVLMVSAEGMAESTGIAVVVEVA